MTISSDAIGLDDRLNQEYTCDGKNISPPLTFSEVPVEAKSLALIMEDPDAPDGTFTHWLLYGMSPATLQIVENHMPMTGQTGTNDFGKAAYGGPCPPSGRHHYLFRLYALDTMLDLPDGVPKQSLLDAMEGHIIEVAETVSTYARKN